MSTPIDTVLWDFVRQPCIRAGCSAEVAVTPDIIWDWCRVQHGPNPEHCKVWDKYEVYIRGEKFPALIREWLEKVHGPSAFEDLQPVLAPDWCCYTSSGVLLSGERAPSVVVGD